MRALLVTALILLLALTAFASNSHCYSPNSYTDVCEFSDGTAHETITPPLGGGVYSFDFSKEKWAQVKPCYASGIDTPTCLNKLANPKKPGTKKSSAKQGNQ